MKRIAVLMTCYNRVDTTLECLRRLFTQEVPDGYSFDVWLVDDASPDKTGEKVKAANPQVNVIQGTGKLFWCKGMRLAWEKAAAAHDYDFYLWLNDDVMLADGALGVLLADSIKIESSGCEIFVVVGPCASSKEGGLAYGCYCGQGCAVLAPVGHPVEAGDKYSMSGNVVLVSKGTFERVGFMYGGYDHAYGDSDYREMMREKGVPMFSASAVVGICPKQPERYVQPQDIGVMARVRLLFSPKGKSLHDVFVYRYRHWGLARALVSTVHVILITLFPGKDGK